jgi:hypothetical protein
VNSVLRLPYSIFRTSCAVSVEGVIVQNFIFFFVSRQLFKNYFAQKGTEYCRVTGPTHVESFSVVQKVVHDQRVN